ncbi:MAG: class II aldolase/adducin family protein [Bacteroidales bacterium]|nr:class II aldolase/adducin family protein [Bacteroidales bacterium]
MNELKTHKKAIAYFMRRLYKQGLTTTSGGNISVRAGDYILVTPSQTDKGRMKAREIGILDMNGINQNPELKLSMETGMHLAVYAARPDVMAIVHAHPPTATAFAVAQKKIDTTLMGESWAILGDIALAPYALMGTPQLAQQVAEAAKNSEVVMMVNHGILAVGKSLLEAFDRIEVLENCAKVNLIVNNLGAINPLSKLQLEAIDKLMNR